MQLENLLITLSISSFIRFLPFAQKGIEKNLSDIYIKEKASGNKVRQVFTLLEGIEQAIAKKITADIKSLKLKVQVKINGNELRIEGKKKDDLQAIIQMIKDANLGIPFQFVNYRD